MSEPLVGIAMAAYKPNVEYFRAQLQSIANQTYTNWFCIIGFDSPIANVRDETNLAKFFTDPRFEFRQNQSQLGLVGNFEATGLACLERNPRYFAYADQDDVWYSNKLAQLVGALASKPQMSIVHCDMNILMRQPDGSFSQLTKTAWKLERRGVQNVSPLDLMIRNVVAGAGLLMDADLVRRYPRIPGEVFGQDHWYPLVASYFGGVHALSEALYDYRIHGNNVAGIGPYRNFLSSSQSSARLGLIRKCILVFNSSSERCRRAKFAKLPVTLLQEEVVAKKFDLGIGYILKAMIVVTGDPALARACLARAAGKLFGLVYPHRREISRT